MLNLLREKISLIKYMKTCLRCGIQVIKKGNLVRHLNKKNLCPSKYLDLEPNEIIENYDKYLDEYNKIILDKKDTDVIKICEYCGKKFKYRSNYYAHKKKYCRKNILEKFSITKEEFELMKKKIEMLENQVSKNNISTKKNNNTNAVNNGSNNNLNSNNQNSNNVTNNITINLRNYGDENLDSISEKELHDIVTRRYNPIIALLTRIHIDIEENRNLYIPDLKLGHGIRYVNGQWEAVSLKELLENVVIDNFNRIVDYVDKKGINDRRLINIMDRFDRDENNIRKYRKEQAKYKLYNARKIIKKKYDETNTF